MSVFVSTTFMPNKSLASEALRLLVGKRIFNIELGSIHKHEDNLAFLLSKKSYNYLIHNFFPAPKERFILNISSTDVDIRRRSLKFIRSSIDFAEKIRARIYTIHPGFLIDPLKESSSSKDYDFEFVGELNKGLSSRYYKECIDIFFSSLESINSYIKDKELTVAVETQGSISKKNFVFFSRPEDFSIFTKKYSGSKIGINLNLAHLYLASKAWGFNLKEVIEKIKSDVVAVEVSHNGEASDSHKALQPSGWYVGVLKDNFFKNIPVIFEGRNLSIDKVEKSYNFLKELLNKN